TSICETALTLGGALEHVANLSTYLTHPPACDAPQEQARVNHHVHDKRLLETMLPEQLAEPLRLGHGSRKTVEHETVRTVRAFDAIRDHAEHNRVGNQFAACHNRLCALPERSTLRYVLAEHIARGQMRRRILARQHFRLD